MLQNYAAIKYVSINIMRRNMTIDKELNRLFAPIMKEMGFKKKGRSYFRVVNDMFQSLTLTKIGGLYCLYRFYIAPLSIGIKDIHNENFELNDFYVPKKKFEMPTLGHYTWIVENDPAFPFGRILRNEETCNWAAQGLYDLACQQLFPLFERTTDSKTAFNELAKMYETLDQCRSQSILLTDNEHIDIVAFRNSMKSDHVMHQLAIMNYNYEFALDYYRKFVEERKEMYNSRNTVFPDSLEYARLSEVKAYIEKTEQLISWLEADNRIEIDNMLAEGTQKSIEYLTSVGWKFK